MSRTRSFWLARAFSLVLRLAGNIVKFFKAHAEEVWPGYDLLRKPFLIYFPERWALLVNHSGPVEGFQPIKPGSMDILRPTEA